MKFVFENMEVTYKAKRTKTPLSADDTCAKCAFNGNNPLCFVADPCDDDEYFKVTRIIPVATK